jgi:hypothetical protein
MFDVSNQMRINHLANGIRRGLRSFVFFTPFQHEFVHFSIVEFIFSVIEQVKYLGLVANIEVRKAGFVYRREFAKFLSRYRQICYSILSIIVDTFIRYAILTKQTWPKWNGKVTDGVIHIVQAMHLEQREVQLGTSKVFIKSPESVRAHSIEHDIHRVFFGVVVDMFDNVQIID